MCSKHFECTEAQWGLTVNRHDDLKILLCDWQLLHVHRVIKHVSDVILECRLFEFLTRRPYIEVFTLRN